MNAASKFAWGVFLLCMAGQPAGNAVGDSTYAESSPPRAFTRAAVIAASGDVMLQGVVAPNGLPASAWFEWGEPGREVQLTTPVSIGQEAALMPLQAGVPGLIAGTTYECSLVSSNALGVSHGAIERFTTGTRATFWGSLSILFPPIGLKPMPVGMTQIYRVAVGRLHCLALQADGTVSAWGRNYCGESDVPAELDDVVAVSGGACHSLALRRDGSVVSWGANDDGQSDVPLDLVNVVSIAAGDYHSIALRADGTVAAWGRNDYGQTSTPEALRQVAAIAAGSMHSLALRLDGTVVGWGAGSPGTSGSPHYGQSTIPAGLSNVVAMAGGWNHSLALRADGTVVAWGANPYGQADVPPGLADVVAVACGGSHNLALQRDGTLVAWGRNERGQTRVPAGLSNVVHTAGGLVGSLAIGANLPPEVQSQQYTNAFDSDLLITLRGSDPNADRLQFRVVTLPTAGQLYQYDNGGRGSAILEPNTAVADAEGRLLYHPTIEGVFEGNPSFAFSAHDGVEESAPATVTIHLPGGPPDLFLAPPIDIRPTTATLQGAVIANLLPTVAWFEWGEPGGDMQPTPWVSVGAGSTMVRLAAPIEGLVPGRPYECRLVVSNAAALLVRCRRFTTELRVAAWGAGGPGAIGMPHYGQSTVSAGLTKAVAVSGTFYQNLVLQNDGTVAVFGVYYDPDGYAPLIPPPAYSNVVAVSAGWVHSAALRSDGSVAVWGHRHYAPTDVPSFATNIVAIACGADHVLALRADGSLVGWGGNLFGQAAIPQDLSNVVAISSSRHNLALTIRGEVVAWGSNPGPHTQVPAGLSNAVAVAAGRNHSLALRSDGTVVAWGDNEYGQCQVPDGLNAVIAIAAGLYHNLALRSDGTLVAWGRNDAGQINVPPGAAKVVGITAGRSHSLVLAENIAPECRAEPVSGAANRDLIVPLLAVDANNDPIVFRIASLPPAGTLYQYAEGARGPAIVLAGTAVEDALGRILFAPAPDAHGDPYVSFHIVANDGLADSAPATISIQMGLATAFTQAPTLIRSSSAVLNGMGVANGLQSSGWFEWGEIGGVVHTTEAVPLGAGAATVRVSSPISGLVAGAAYECRLVVSNIAGPTRGAPQWFAAGQRLYAWGENNFGQTNVPLHLTNVVAVSAGYGHTLTLDANGQLTAWGWNAWEQATIPFNLTEVVAIASGFAHNLALRADGTVAGWGLNEYGQADPPANLSNVIAVACGGRHSLALQADGTVVAWGDPESGATEVPAGLSNVVAISGGHGFSLALQANATVVGWGYSNFNLTTDPLGLRRIIAIAAGDDHALALEANGAVIAWGFGYAGSTNVPSDLGRAVGIAAGFIQSAALLANGTVAVWGDLKQPPPGLGGVVNIAAGWQHLVALGGNLPPKAHGQLLSCAANRKEAITLTASDPENNPLHLMITSLPAGYLISLPGAGALYQYADSGLGEPILNANTPVSDPSGRVIFVPNSEGEIVFSFTAHDHQAASAPAMVHISVFPPSAPRLTYQSSTPGGAFTLVFTGDTNGAYRVWVSSNLEDWQSLGPPMPVASNRFEFVDPYRTNWPQRFYRMSAP